MLDKRYKVPKLILIDENTDIYKKTMNEDDFRSFFFQSEIVIEKSLFICTLAHCDSVDGARNAIDFIQKKYKDASHNCYAFQVKEPKSTSHMGYSDDNEPHGTAGKPMLTSLLYADIGEIVAVVTRYFGGVKLGTGGLVRAYQGAVAKALEEIESVEKVEKTIIKIVLEYNNTTHLHRIIEEFDALVENEEYSEKAVFTICLPEDRKDAFIQKIQDLTSSKCLI